MNMWRTGTGSAITIVVTVTLATILAAQERPRLLIETPRHFGTNVEEAERYLNRQAALGYRLVSLRHLQVWEREGSRPAREYRIVGESNRGDFGQRVSTAARDGFRVLPDAWIPLGSDIWSGAPTGAVVMERDTTHPASCTYDLHRFSDLVEDSVRLPPGVVLLALPLDGPLVESCGNAGSVGKMTLRTLDTTRWFRDQVTALRRLGEQLTAAASEGCRPVWVRVTPRGSATPSVKAVIACEATPGAQPLEFLIVPVDEALHLTDAPSKWAPAQAALNKAAADGFCLSSVVLDAADFLMQRRAADPTRCEYRLVAGADSRSLDIVRLGLDRQFFPVLRRSPEPPILLERRAPGQ